MRHHRVRHERTAHRSRHLQIQAVSGVLDSTGQEDGPPMPIAIPIVEQVAGIYAAASVLAALRVRRRDGLGQSIEIALYDVGFSLMTSFLPVLLGGEPHAPVTASAIGRPWSRLGTSIGLPTDGCCSVPEVTSSGDAFAK